MIRNHINNVRLIAICSVLCLCIGCSTSSPNENAEAAGVNITLLEWTQQEIDIEGVAVGFYSDVVINYKIENTGSVDISSYEVYFRAETINNKAYESAGSGEDLKVGEIDFKSVRIDTDHNQVTKVEITGHFLE